MLRETETTTERQVRLLLEQQCADVFLKTLLPLFGFAPVTLIIADYGEPQPLHNVAFKTTLGVHELITTAELLVERWTRPPEKLLLPHDYPHRDRYALPVLERATQATKDALAAGIGHAIIVGRGKATNYISSMDRGGVSEMLRETLLPAWRQEAG